MIGSLAVRRAHVDRFLGAFMSIPSLVVRAVVALLSVAAAAHAQSTPLAVPRDALTLTELLHSIVPELRDSTAQLQLTQSGDEWRFRIESPRLGDRIRASADGVARLRQGRLVRLSMRHSTGARRISTEDSQPTPARRSGTQPQRFSGFTPQQALDFASAGLQKALGAIEPTTTVFSAGRSATLEWRFDVQATAAGVSAVYSLEFDPANGRLLSVEGR